MKAVLAFFNLICKKMKNKIFFLLMLNLSVVGYAQQSPIFRGIIMDANTNLPLKEVGIYRISAGDTLKMQSGVNGEFQLPFKAGSRLLFKKKGYAWHVLRKINDSPQQIKLVPSNPGSKIKLFDQDEKRKEGKMDLYFDGQLVPETEWADALCIDPKEIRDLGISSKDGRHKFYIITE